MKVKYINWEQTPGALNGHRYCEPDTTSAWFWQYPQTYVGDPNTGAGVSDPDELAFKDTKAQVGSISKRHGRSEDACLRNGLAKDLLAARWHRTS